MTLDSSVVNVAISTIATDVGTTVAGVQSAITLYLLVMAMFMVTGGKIGSIAGRRRAFAIGCVVYRLGSLITALAPEPADPRALLVGVRGSGRGADPPILPAIIALVAGNVPVHAGAVPRFAGCSLGRHSDQVDRRSTAETSSPTTPSSVPVNRV
jgi:MFS family permease